VTDFELIAAAITLAGVLCTALGSIAGWPLGVVGAALYVLIFFETKLYAETVLQAFYIVMGFYGWWTWRKTGHSRPERPVTRMPVNIQIFSILLTAAGGIITGLLMDQYSDTDVPYLDALLGFSGLVITGQMAKKYLENWIWWIVVDLAASVLFYYKGLTATAVLYLFLASLAAMGFIKWKKELLLN